MKQFGVRFWTWILAATVAAVSGCSDTTGVDHSPSLEVTVREAPGQPVPNVTVEIQRSGSPISRAAVTDNTGTVRLERGALEAGTYAVLLRTPAGYALAPGQENPVSVRLEEGVTPLAVVSFTVVKTSAP